MGPGSKPAMATWLLGGGLMGVGTVKLCPRGSHYWSESESHSGYRTRMLAWGWSLNGEVLAQSA